MIGLKRNPFIVTQALVLYLRSSMQSLALVCNVYCDFVTSPFSILVQAWHLILSIPYPCCLSNFEKIGKSVIDNLSESGNKRADKQRELF